MMIHVDNAVVIMRIDRYTMCLQKQRMQSKAEDKEWGVKTIKQRRSDEHGNIEFLAEWDGDWMNAW